jgi:hypothetical protein
MADGKDYQKSASVDSEIAVEELSIPVYQRDRLSRHTIEQIKADFHWDQFGRPVIKHLNNGSYEVVDGQHRAVAIDEMWGGKTVIPVHVTQRPKLIDREGLFVDLNRNRKTPTAVELFRAEVVAKRPEALGIKQICDKLNVLVGYRARTSLPNRCGSINQLRHLYRYGGDVLERTLGVLSQAFPDDGQRFEAVNLAGTGYLIATYPELDDGRLVKNLGAKDAAFIGRGVAVVRGYTGSTNTIKGPAALVILREYNARLGASKRLDEQVFIR